MNKRKKIILVAVLLAMLVILSRFLSIRTPIMKIGFGFLPTMLCAIWLGPKWTLLLNVLGDLIGATLFPTGPFFIGYTISTAVAALIYGCLLYQGYYGRKWLAFRTILATVLVAVVVNMALNTLWTSITAGQAFWPLLGTRIVKQLIMIPVHVIIFLAAERILRRPYQKYLCPSAATATHSQAKTGAKDSAKQAVDSKSNEKSSDNQASDSTNSSDEES